MEIQPVPPGVFSSAPFSFSAKQKNENDSEVHIVLIVIEVEWTPGSGVKGNFDFHVRIDWLMQLPWCIIKVTSTQKCMFLMWTLEWSTMRSKEAKLNFTWSHVVCFSFFQHQNFLPLSPIVIDEGTDGENKQKEMHKNLHLKGLSLSTDNLSWEA